ncbi:MAG: amidase, partial [Saprospiraceae bacterium]
MKKLLYLLPAFLLGAFTTHYINLAEITKEDIQHATKISSLEFTDAEIEMLLPGVNEVRESYQKNRKRDLPNSVPPSLVFNPLPTGYTPSQLSQPSAYSDYAATKMPANRDDLAWYTVGQLAHLIKTKQIS